MPLALTRVKLWLRAILGRRRLERDMQAEMREHLDRAAARLVAGGLSPDDARLAARREFGNVTVIQEQARDARGARWVDAVAGDLQFALRYFSRHKAAVSIIVVVLALSTGANTVIFSVFQGHFLRPAPAVSNDAALARIWARQRPTRTGQWSPRGFTLPELSGLAERRDVFEEVAAYTAHDVVIGGRDGMPARGVGACRRWTEGRSCAAARPVYRCRTVVSNRRNRARALGHRIPANRVAHRARRWCAGDPPPGCQRRRSCGPADRPRLDRH